MRSDYVSRDIMAHILAALMPDNRLAIETSMATGLRINDVLSLPTRKLAQRMTVREAKTGKARRVYLPVDLYERLRRTAGRYYVFEGRTDPERHRTRQAVYKDIKRAAKLFRLPGKLQLSPHTARKIYAVSEYQRSHDLARVQRLLNHSNEAVTMIYAMADQLTARKMGGRANGQ